MEPALRYEAIQQGNIQITDAYSTDPEIAQYNLVVLEDDQHLFPPYQGAPLMKEALLKKTSRIGRHSEQVSWQNHREPNESDELPSGSRRKTCC